MRKIILTIEFDEFEQNINRNSLFNRIDDFIKEKTDSYRIKMKEARSGIGASFSHVTLAFERNRNNGAFEEMEKEFESKNGNTIKIIE